jgi:alkylation response protein AidB-like acyl-CoA dehydrogenase
MMTERDSQLGQAGDPGPVGSVGKLFAAEHAVKVHELIVDLLGADGMRYPVLGRDGAPVQPTAHVAFLRSRANTIEGGTSEVMRNILSERVLGLPRDDLGSKDRPWREVPRG